jgi:hypothetical protein
MSNRIAATIATALLAAFCTFVPPAYAATNYPWCIQYGGGRQGIDAVSCGFVSYAQCMETARGMGSMCLENPAYSGPTKHVFNPRHKKKPKN